MAFDVSKLADIVDTMDRYIAAVRPRPEIRAQLDLGYELVGNSVFLHEIRPVWNDRDKIMRNAYAKATFVKSQGIWKIYWLRGNLKWEAYEPVPVVKKLSEFLKVVDEDVHCCFKG